MVETGKIKKKKKEYNPIISGWLYRSMELCIQPYFNADA